MNIHHRRHPRTSRIDWTGPPPLPRTPSPWRQTWRFLGFVAILGIAVVAVLVWSLIHAPWTAS